MIQNIGKTLKILRKKSSKSASDIIAELDEKYSIKIASSTLYGYENGVAMPNADVFWLYARFINVKMFYLNLDTRTDRKATSTLLKNDR